MNIKDEIKKLNKEQREAVVEKNSRRLLVIAGAGSGKTRVLTVRISYLLELGVKAENIFSVTFTNKAANEMKERVMELSPNFDINGMWIGTFHSLSMRLVNDNLNKTNIRKNFNILDSDDQKTLIKSSISGLQEKRNDEIFPKDEIKEVIKGVQFFINKSKENELRSDNKEIYEMLKFYSLPEFYADIYEEYENQRIFSNSMDFTDLILYGVEILRDNKDIRDFYCKKFRHIFVDEFQDTNPIQYTLIDLLTDNKTYHTMVGDDDQLIYSWRGANIDNIDSYNRKNKDKIKIVKLEQNYRSYENILGAANKLIGENKKRMGKNLWSSKGAGEKIKVIECYHQDDEAVDVVSNIKKLLRGDYQPSDIAILYRNNYLSRPFEGQLTKGKIPYKIIGGVSFWQRKEIKDVMSYILLINNEDNDVAFERAISSPKRGIGQGTIKKIKQHSILNGLSLFSSLKEMISSNKIKGKSAKSADDFIGIIEDLKNSEYSINRMINNIIIRAELEEHYKKEGSEAYTVRKENLDELANYSTFYDGIGIEKIGEFIQNTAIQSDNEKDEKKDSVSLMTIHGSKGLEFPVVFLVGFEDGIFPSNQSIAALSKDKYALEEERRLAYVGITRAKEKLNISFSNNRFRQPMAYSRFLDELPVEYLEYSGKSIYGKSRIGKKINNQKKDNTKIHNVGYSVGDSFNDEIMGEGEIVEIDDKGGYYEINIDYGFLGLHKKIIKK